MNRIFQTTLLSLLIILSGCTSLAPQDPPELTLVGLKFQKSSIFESTVEATLRVINPAPKALAIQGASFKLLVDGHTVGRGVSQNQLAVEGLSSQTFTMLFHINNASAIFRLRQLIDTNSSEYGIKGKLYLSSSYGTKAVRIDRRGIFNLEDGQQLLAPGS